MLQGVDFVLFRNIEIVGLCIESCDQEDGHGGIETVLGRTKSLNSCTSCQSGKALLRSAKDPFLISFFQVTNYFFFLQVRLIGYCVEGSLFLIYEYVENGNLGQHLHGSGTQHKTPPKKKKKQRTLLETCDQ